MDPINILPPEVFERVLYNLSAKDLITCSLVNEQWNIAANNDNLWKKICIKKSWYHCGSLEGFITHFSFLAPQDRDYFWRISEWKRHFILKTQLQNNWVTGKYVDCDIKTFCRSKVDENDEFDDHSITSVSSNGINIIAFGYQNGELQLFDLSNNGRLISVVICALMSPITFIEIVKNVLILVQDNLLQIYMIENCKITMKCAKVFHRDEVNEVNVIALEFIEHRMRSLHLNDSWDANNENCTEISVVCSMSETYLFAAPVGCNFVYMWNLESDLFQLDFTFNFEHNYELLQVHCCDDVLYVFMSTKKSNTLILEGYSIKYKNRLFTSKEDLLNRGQDFSQSMECSVESNECYLLLKFLFNYYILYNRKTGKSLIHGLGRVYINANGDSEKIGRLVDSNDVYAFKILNPKSEEIFFSIAIQGSPIYMCSNVLVTLCVEFNHRGFGTTEVEFFNTSQIDSEEKINSLWFHNNADVILIYSDCTKLVFYTGDKMCLIRNFLV